MLGQCLFQLGARSTPLTSFQTRPQPACCLAWWAITTPRMISSGLSKAKPSTTQKERFELLGLWDARETAKDVWRFEVR